MKFKASLTDNGVALLEKRFIPALEKMGPTNKLCYLYLTRDHTFFLHNLLPLSDAVQTIAQFRIQTLFSDYRISSNNDDRIVFSVDLSLLLRALRSAAAISAVSNHPPQSGLLQIKLVKKLLPNSTLPTPFLTFETQGTASAVIQDIPISKPLSRSLVLELQSSLDSAQDLPRTLVGVDDLNRLTGYVDRMKQLGDVVDVFVGKNGDFELSVSNSLVSFRAEFKRLAVVGDKGNGGDGSVNDEGDGLRVQVGMKHLVKCLQGLLTRPDCTFYGIGAQSGSLVVVFQFLVPGSRQTDKSISLHCRLPVIDPGCN